MRRHAASATLKPSISRDASPLPWHHGYVYDRQHLASAPRRDLSAIRSGARRVPCCDGVDCTGSRHGPAAMNARR